MGPIPRTPERQHDDSGFSLVEAVVALFVLGVIFTALAMASIGSLRASMDSRAAQQGIDFATQALERVRALDFPRIANRPADLTGDPAVVAGSPDCSSIGSGSTLCVDVTGAGDYEPLVLSESGAVFPHVDAAIPSENANNVNFKTYTYVTTPIDGSSAQVRVTVVARWDVAGVSRSRSTSSLIARTAGTGLPLPKFELTPLSNMREVVGPGASAKYLFRVTNQGAPDRWNLRATGFEPGIWSFYRETGASGFCADLADCPDKQPDELDVLLTDSNADLVVDTGKVDPTDSVQFWLVGQVPATTAPSLGVPSSLIVTAASVLQPPGAVPSGVDSACTAFAAIAGIACQPAEVDVVAATSASATPTVSATPTPSATPSSSSGVSTPPGAPTGLTSTIGNGELSLSWTEPPAGSGTIDHYTVKYKLASASIWTELSPSPTQPSTVIGPLDNKPYDIQVFAVNSANLTGPGSSIITATPNSYDPPARCAASGIPLAGGADPSFLIKQYILNNESPWNTLWPANGLLSRTDTQQLPLWMMVSDKNLLPQNSNLPVYSADIDPEEPGRILRKSDAGFSESYTATTKVVDWRSDISGKQYKGTAVLRLWVAPLEGTDMSDKGISLNAQLFKASNGNRQPSASKLRNTSNSLAVASSPISNPWACGGWQQVWFAFYVDTTKFPLASNEYIGVRVWNAGGAGLVDDVRIAYGVTGDFVATLEMPEN